jgi:hypothetical protein
VRRAPPPEPVLQCRGKSLIAVKFEIEKQKISRSVTVGLFLHFVKNRIQRSGSIGASVYGEHIDTESAISPLATASSHHWNNAHTVSIPFLTGGIDALEDRRPPPPEDGRALTAAGIQGVGDLVLAIDHGPTAPRHSAAR